jgi:hypothetical protein
VKDRDAGLAATAAGKDDGAGCREGKLKSPEWSHVTSSGIRYSEFLGGRRNKRTVALVRASWVFCMSPWVSQLSRLGHSPSWNCTHIANANIRAKLESLCRSHGLQPPMICTPEELLA